MFSHTWTLEDGSFVTLEILGSVLRIAIEGATAGGDHAIFAAFMPLLEAETFLAKAKEHAAASAVALPGAMPMTKEKTDD